MEVEILTKQLSTIPNRRGEGFVDLKKLREDIRILVTLKETDDPVLTCYLNLETGETSYRNSLDERAYLLRKSLRREVWRGVEESLIKIESFLENQLLSDTRGVAIFARFGAYPFFLPLQFRVRLPNWIVVDSTPNIYHLVELKGTYHRYVILLISRESARILEVNLGSVTERIWKERPELRKRIGHEWTRKYYQNHCKGRNDDFVEEMVKILNQMMSTGGHTHLIIVGNPQMTSRVRKNLPIHLTAKLIETLVASDNSKISNVVAATLDSFIQKEEKESQAMVDHLLREINTNGLAVVGTTKTLSALAWGQVDVLLLTNGYVPDPGWLCPTCGAMEVNHVRPDTCAYCEGKEIREANIKEEMVRMAERCGCRIEIVNQSEVLTRFGGVGCLLRYISPRPLVRT
jgi:protein required for attachment to host cells